MVFFFFLFSFFLFPFFFVIGCIACRVSLSSPGSSRCRLTLSLRPNARRPSFPAPLRLPHRPRIPIQPTPLVLSPHFKATSGQATVPRGPYVSKRFGLPLARFMTNHMHTHTSQAAPRRQMCEFWCGVLCARCGVRRASFEQRQS
jgi:hypothetical protein